MNEVDGGAFLREEFQIINVEVVREIENIY